MLVHSLSLWRTKCELGVFKLFFTENSPYTVHNAFKVRYV